VALAAGAASGLLGFSVRLAYEHWGSTIGEADICELSLTPQPADPGAVVLAVGGAARALWALWDAPGFLLLLTSPLMAGRGVGVRWTAR
jgi:hypothetical protein